MGGACAGGSYWRERRSRLQGLVRVNTGIRGLVNRHIARTASILEVYEHRNVIGSNGVFGHRFLSLFLIIIMGGHCD